MPKFRIVAEIHYSVDADDAPTALGSWEAALIDGTADQEYHAEEGSITVYDANGDRCTIEAQ